MCTNYARPICLADLGRNSVELDQQKTVVIIRECVSVCVWVGGGGGGSG